MATISYLDRFLDPVTEALTPALARTIVELRADSETQARVERLRQKSSDGTLTADESLEYQDFVEAVDIVSILQSKARKYLAMHAE